MSTNEPVLVQIGTKVFRVVEGTEAGIQMNYQEAKAWGERNERIVTND